MRFFRNNRIKREAPCRCLDGHVKEPYEMSMALGALPLVQLLLRSACTSMCLEVRITDEGLIPGMHIWFILLIKSDLKWCIHLSRSLFLYFKYKVKMDYAIHSLHYPYLRTTGVPHDLTRQILVI